MAIQQQRAAVFNMLILRTSLRSLGHLSRDCSTALIAGLLFRLWSCLNSSCLWLLFFYFKTYQAHISMED